MTQFNPFIPAIAATPAIERQQAAERVGQVRRQQDLKKNSALNGQDRFEHQVESADSVAGANGEDQSGAKQPKQQKHPPRDDENDDRETLDVTA